MSSAVLLVGAGDLGERIGHRLHDAGAAITAMRRRIELLPPEFRPLRADFTSEESINSGCKALDTPAAFDSVVFVVTADERTEAGYQKTYVDGLQKVLDAVVTKRVVVVSSTAVYHQQSGEWVDETSATEPTTFSGRAMLDMERTAAESEASSVAVRLAGVYGPGRERLVGQVRAGSVNVPPSPRFTNRIHVDDAAALVALVADPSWRPGGQGVPPVVLGVDDETAEQRDVIEWLAAELDVEFSSLADDSERPAANKRCRNDLARSLGWVPQYPTFRDGYRQILRS